MKQLIGILGSLFFLLTYPATAQHWLRNGGDVGNEEALAVAVDDSGNVYTAGYFSGSFQLDTVQLLTRGAADAFVAKISPTGQFQWILPLGGLGDERATALHISKQGRIFVGGNFSAGGQYGNYTLQPAGNQDIFLLELSRGGQVITAHAYGGSGFEEVKAIAADDQGVCYLSGAFAGQSQFGTFSVTSTLNPQTSASSNDIFLFKVNAGGVGQWLKQGASALDDSGGRIALDDSGNVYCLGQFSDTMTFVQYFPNNIYNAAYLAKFSPGGNLIWFRKIGGSGTNEWNGVALAAGGVCISGVAGSGTVFFGPVNHVINSNYPYNATLVKYTSGGDYLSSGTTGSDNPLRGAFLSRSGTQDYWMSGTFECKFTSLQSKYGSGRFISSGQKDIWLIRYDVNAAMQTARQLGGKKDERIFGLATAKNGQAVLAGSFNTNVIVPVNSVFPIYSNQSAGLCAASTGLVCNDNDYGNFMQATCLGGYDFFVGPCIDTLRAPYDFFFRETGTCSDSLVKGCIGFKGNDIDLHADSLKSCGNTMLFAASNTSSAVAGQTNCSPGPDFVYQWSTGASTPAIPVSQSGYYSLTAASLDGCISFTDQVYVTVNQSPPLPALTDDKGINIQSMQPLPIRVCVPDSVKITANLSTTNPFVWTIGGNNYTDTTRAFYFNQAGAISATLTVTDSNQCKSQISIAMLSDSALPAIWPAIHFEKDTMQICRGEQFSTFVYDSVADPGALLDCSFANSTFFWTVSSGDSLIPACLTKQKVSFYPDSSGFYAFYVKFYRISDCGQPDSMELRDTVFITVNPLPVVNASVINLSGQDTICIGDSIHLAASGGFLYNWTGPGLPSGITDSAIVVQLPGSYCVTVTDSTPAGCKARSSGCINLYTPAPVTIVMQPGSGVICPGDSVSIQAGPGTHYEWHGPQGIIPDTTARIYVKSAGTYYCLVSSSSGCPLITNSLELRTYASPALVAVPIPVICNGRPVEIRIIADGTTTINWGSPFNGSDSVQVVQTPGIYTCTVTACQIQTPLSIEIKSLQLQASIQPTGTLKLCSGDSLLLQANLNMQVYAWSPLQSSDSVVWVTQPGSYAVFVMDQFGCTDTSEVVQVLEQPMPPDFILSGPDSLCGGSTLQLDATVTTTGNFHWEGPNGFQSSALPLVISNVQPSNSGTYIAVLADSVCNRRKSLDVFVQKAAALALSSPMRLCLGQQVFLSPYNGDGQLNWILPDGSAFTGDSIQISGAATDSGWYVLSLNQDICSRNDSVLIQLTDCVTDFPNVFSPNGDGINDYFTSLSSRLQVREIRIINRWGGEVYSGKGPGWDGTNNEGKALPQATYYYTVLFETATGVEMTKGFVQLLR